MALDGKILVRAKGVLAEKRREHEELSALRVERVYSKNPRVRELDTEIRATMAELVGAALNPNAEVLIEDIRIRNLELQEQRKNEIVNSGYPVDYLDVEYICEICHDTGYVNATMCVCLKTLYNELQKASLSSLLKLGNETFDNFDLSFYDDSPASGTSISPKRSMEDIYEFCVEYARKFGSKSMNLLFIGAPGLGKTFLSACIARVVADNGFSVVYDMAGSIFAKFEDVQFQRTDDLIGVKEEIKRCMECDLLIIDDLGTEMTTAFTISVLYEIVNTRLITGKKTLVSTNLTSQELHKKYSEQIMSRLEGEYQVLRFYGDDIRKKKNQL